MFVHDWLASEVTRIVSTAGPLLTACFVVFFVSRDLVKVDASIWGCDFFNMMHMFSLYIYLFLESGHTATCWRYVPTINIPKSSGFDLISRKKALGKSVFTLSLHQVQQTHYHCQHLTLFTGVSRKLLWFCRSLCYSWDSWKDGSSVVWEQQRARHTLRKHDTRFQRWQNTFILGKGSRGICPPFNKQLKRA